MTQTATTYRVSEVGFVHPKAFASLGSALRVVARIVAKNEADGESNYIFVRDNAGRTVVEIHETAAR